MKISTLAPVLLTVLAGSVYAQDVAHPDFATADTDKDGLLSISEVQAALPDVTINDENADGFVNQSEAEAAISGLAFESNGYTGGSSLVSEPEYGLIVGSLDSDASGDAAADAEDAGLVDDTADDASEVE